MIITFQKSLALLQPAWIVKDDRIECGKNKVYLYDEMSELQLSLFAKHSYPSLIFQLNKSVTILRTKDDLEERMKLIEAFYYISQYVKVSKDGRNDLSKFYKWLNIDLTKALTERKDEYLDLVEDNNYKRLKKMYDALPQLYNQFARNVLNTPLQLTKPMSASSVAFLGTMVAGSGVGMIKGVEAIKKQELYEKNKKDVVQANIVQECSYRNLDDCIKQIDLILSSDDKTKDSWTKIKMKEYKNRLSEMGKYENR
jgi:hypothetical protein